MKCSVSVAKILAKRGKLTFWKISNDAHLLIKNTNNAKNEKAATTSLFVVIIRTTN